MSTQAQDQLPDKPRPEPSAMSQPYWNGLIEHRLMVQRCTNCGKRRHYPRPLCDACYSFDFAWDEISLDGRVHSWAVSHHAFHPGFKREVPYLSVTVDMEDGIRMHAPLDAPDDIDIAIGTPVRLGFDKVDDELTLPKFVIAKPS